jgi:hypothetical protein
VVQVVHEALATNKALLTELLTYHQALQTGSVPPSCSKQQGAWPAAGDFQTADGWKAWKQSELEAVLADAQAQAALPQFNAILEVDVQQAESLQQANSSASCIRSVADSRPQLAARA